MKLSAPHTTRILILFFLFVVAPLNSTAHAKSPSKTNATHSIASGLIYVRKEDKDCKIQLWNLHSQKNRILFKPKTCPKDISVISNHSKIVLMNRTTIEIISIDNKVTTSGLLTVPIEKDKNHKYKPDIVLVTYHPDGSLLVYQRSYNPADDSNNYLWKFDGKTWSLLKKLHCRRFGPCNFDIIKKIEKKNNKLTKDSYIWNLDKTSSPYLIKKQSRVELINNYDTTIVDLFFNIDGSKSVVNYATIKGPDTGSTLLMGVSLKTQGKLNTVLSQRQCTATIVDKYILVRRFWRGGTELMDIKTGKSILGLVKQTHWAYFNK